MKKKMLVLNRITMTTDMLMSKISVGKVEDKCWIDLVRISTNRFLSKFEN
jgi:hypothetical protein